MKRGTGFRAGVGLLPLLLGVLPAMAQSPAPAFLHRLASFSGELSNENAPIHVDAVHNETYVAEADSIRVFNAAGMEIFQFFTDLNSGAVADLTLDADGSILVLSNRPDLPEAPRGSLVTTFDARGRIQDVIRPVGLPDDEEFLASFLDARNGSLYWVDAWRKLVVQTDRSGAVRRVYDLGEAAAAGVDASERSPAATPGQGGEITGFSLDRSGRFLFTIAVFFRAFRLDPESGSLEAFGRAGSGPGRFGLIAGIAEDEWGQVYVADRARSVVLVFDRSLEFTREFGVRGPVQTRLSMPHSLAYGRGRIYVSQWRGRGISVFSVGSPEP